MQVQSKGRAAEVVDLLKATAAETGSKGGGSLEGGSEDVEWISTAHLHAAEHTVVLCDALKRKDRPPDASEHLGFCLVLRVTRSNRLQNLAVRSVIHMYIIYDIVFNTTPSGNKGYNGGLQPETLADASVDVGSVLTAYVFSSYSLRASLLARWWSRPNFLMNSPNSRLESLCQVSPTPKEKDGTRGLQGGWPTWVYIGNLQPKTLAELFAG
eukprot:1160573-Pelagomonas_calceolata.AAC.39